MLNKKYNSYAGGQVLSTYPEYVRACREADRIRDKQRRQARLKTIHVIYKKSVNLVRKHPIIFSFVAITIVAF